MAVVELVSVIAHEAESILFDGLALEETFADVDKLTSMLLDNRLVCDGLRGNDAVGLVDRDSVAVVVLE